MPTVLGEVPATKPTFISIAVSLGDGGAAHVIELELPVLEAEADWQGLDVHLAFERLPSGELSLTTISTPPESRHARSGAAGSSTRELSF